MILHAWGWCTGTTLRDGMGREDRGGFRMVNTYIPWQIHFDMWQNEYNTVQLKNKIKMFLKKGKDLELGQIGGRRRRGRQR